MLFFDMLSRIEQVSSHYIITTSSVTSFVYVKEY